MAYQEPDNGTIFLRENRSQNPKAPKWKGDGKDDQGRKIEVAIWEGVKNGKAWMRMAIKPAYQGGGRLREQTTRQIEQPLRGIDPQDVPPADSGDTIPF